MCDDRSVLPQPRNLGNNTARDGEESMVSSFEDACGISISFTALTSIPLQSENHANFFRERHYRRSSEIRWVGGESGLSWDKKNEDEHENV